MVGCPECTKDGLVVEKIIVANHAKESCWPLGDETYYHCENPDCEMVYFPAFGSRSLKISDIKTRVTFKVRTSPRPLCYCKQVTEEDVIKAIGDGAANVDEVRNVTGIGGGGHCKITNPAGRCCLRNYKSFIDLELKKWGKGGSDGMPMIIK